MRLIFFLEESSNELRSMAVFLNQQMKDTDLLIVESRQYELENNQRIVVPSLFGFSEQARTVKQEAVKNSGNDSSENGFWQGAESQGLQSDSIEGMRRLIVG
jgi:hypothetical protein